MIIGMVPMALGLGEGGEQNAPLGRAVIGGLIFATIATLMFVPVVFSMVHKKQGAKAAAASEMPHAALNRRPPVSRRKLGIFGVVALIGGGAASSPPASGPARMSERQAQGMDRQPGRSRRSPSRFPNAKALSPTHRSAGPAGGLFARADLRARQRLSEKLERRHRRPGQGRPADRRDRGAGPRPAIAAGAGRSRQPAGQRATVGGDADAAQVAARLELRLDAGDRRAHRRPRQQEGCRQFRRRPMSSGWKRWPATRRSPRRSTASSPRATPMSAR